MHTLRAPHFIRHARSQWPTVAASALLSLACTAQAGVVSATVTAKDFYAAYIGQADGSGLTAFGADLGGFHGSGGGYAVAETYANVFAAAGSYLYVVAWGAVGQEGAPGMQATITNLAGGTVHTNATDWQAVQLAQPYAGFGNGIDLPAPPNVTLANHIAAAAWTDTIVQGGTQMEGDVVGGGQSQWIWANSFTNNVNDGSYVIFRLALDANTGGGENNVPVPASAALALLGLGLLAAQRRAGAAAL
jgi:hypothetical protein